MHRTSNGRPGAIESSEIRPKGGGVTPREPLSVLLIEVDGDHAKLAQQALAKCRSQFDVDWVTSIVEAGERIAARTFDAVLCNLGGESHETDTLAALRELCPEIPVVVLASEAGAHLASAALDQGAQDYLMKEVLSTASGSEILERSMRYAIQRQFLAAQMQQLYRDAQYHQGLLQEKNKRLAQLYKVAQNVVENVSHEFRTPLTVIKEYVALLREGMLGDISKEQEHFLDVVGDRAEDLNRMVDDMLDVSKLDAGLLTVRRNECDFSEVVRHVEQHLRRKAALKGVALEIELEANLPKVYCDSDKAGRTIVNLVVNAIKFCRDPGLVRLWAHFDQEAQEVVVEISDNGPGIEARDLKRIFSRFTQVDLTLRDDTKGFGLGLSIVKELVEMSLGRISVASEVGQGSRFSFTIPCANPVDVARRFLERLKDQDGTRCALLCAVRAVEAQPQELNDIEPLLHYVMRSNDLVFRVQPDEWILLLACDQASFEIFHARLKQVLKQTNRNRIKQPLPMLTAEVVAQWDVEHGMEDILAKVSHCAHYRETMHV